MNRDMQAKAERGAQPRAKNETRRPLLLIVMLVIIVLALAAFLLLRPRGPGASQQTSPASPNTTQH